jgi:hypothetical protein
MSPAALPCLAPIAFDAQDANKKRGEDATVKEAAGGGPHRVP